MPQQITCSDEETYKRVFASVGLQISHLVFPVFVSNNSAKIRSMPETTVIPIQGLVEYIQSVTANSNISSLIIFGIPKNRDQIGSSAFDKKGIIQESVRQVKSAFGKAINVITDVCVCQYNLSGHCGIVTQNGKVNNDATLKVLAKIAASHAEAGADVVAPSAMMDGQVYALKRELYSCGLNASILSFSAKHTSSLYTPFRSVAYRKSAETLDKSSYQISYANSRVALLEMETDINEGADMVMIKPALMYLDLVRMAKDKLNFPLAAQNVSGEYAMIKAAAMHGWIDEEDWKVRSIASIKRAGADKIISYFALDIVKYL